jgi:hypothetical protein
MGIRKALGLALVLAAIAGSAQAFTGNLGANPPDGPYSYALPKGQSTDTIKFSLTTAADFDFKLFSTNTSGNYPTGFFDLFDSTSHTLVDSGSYSSSVPSFTSLDLSKGNYYFSINDFATKPVVKPFLNLDLNVSAIPEPQTYAMMLAGLAVVGASFRRRRALA